MEDKTNPFVRPPFLAPKGMYSPSNIKLKQDPMPTAPTRTEMQAPVAAEFPVGSPVDPQATPFSDMMRFKTDLISQAMQLLGPEKANAETYRMLSEAPLGDVMKLVDQLMPKSAN